MKYLMLILFLHLRKQIQKKKQKTKNKHFVEIQGAFIIFEKSWCKLIVVTEYKDRITVKGHAGYAEIGKDIVCASISTLTQTLIKSIEDLTVDKIQYGISPGSVDIYIKTLSDETKTLIKSFFVGCKAIAEAYPENVRVITER